MALMINPRLRAFLEKLSRGVILRRRFPKEFQRKPILVSPEGGGLRYWRFNLNKVDPMLLDLSLHYIEPGSVVWDIGANVGLFAFASAQLVGRKGRVLAVEPDCWLVNLLRRSKDLKGNRELKIDIMSVAVSEKVDIEKFYIAESSRSVNHLAISRGALRTGGIREIQTVPTVNLDWLLNKHSTPRFVKIDAEGAEHLVLRGAEKVLSEIRPVVLCEVLKGNRKIVTDIFRRYDYVMFDANRENMRSIESAAYNTLAIAR